MKCPAIHVVRSGSDWLVLVDHRLRSTHKSQAGAVSFATKIKREHASLDASDGKAPKR